MGRFLNSILVQSTLEEKGLNLFTLLEFQRLFNVSKIAARKFTESYTKKRLFERLKGGLFVLKHKRPSFYSIANKLYQPSYISLETALSHYHLIPEVIYPMTSITTKPTREFTALNNLFIYQRIKKQAFTGYAPAKDSYGKTILMAEQEKAIIDYLYFVSLGKKSINDRFDLRKLDKKKMLEYAKLFKRPSLIKLAKQIYHDYATSYNPVIY